MERDTTQNEQENRRIPATVRLDPEDHEFFQKWAEREERSMSQVLRIALERYRASLKHRQLKTPVGAASM